MENQIQPNISSDSPLTESFTQPAVSTSSNRYKIVLLVLSGLIIMIGLVTVGTQIGKRQTIKPQQITNQLTLYPTQIITSPTATPSLPSSTVNLTVSAVSPTVNPIDGWKKYISAKDRYQISYPENWKIDESTLGTSLVISNPNNKYPDGTFTVIVGRGRDSCDQDLNIAKNWNWQNFSERPVVVGTVKGIELSGKTDYTDGVYYDRKYISIKGQSNCYIFDYWSFDKDQTYFLDQILSTFKFLE